jgi:hypothetical protein
MFPPNFSLIIFHLLMFYESIFSGYDDFSFANHIIHDKGLIIVRSAQKISDE